MSLFDGSCHTSFGQDIGQDAYLSSVCMLQLCTSSSLLTYNPRAKDCSTALVVVNVLGGYRNSEEVTSASLPKLSHHLPSQKWRPLSPILIPHGDYEAIAGHRIHPIAARYTFRILILGMTLSSAYGIPQTMIIQRGAALVCLRLVAGWTWTVDRVGDGDRCLSPATDDVLTARLRSSSE